MKFVSHNDNSGNNILEISWHLIPVCSLQNVLPANLNVCAYKLSAYKNILLALVCVKTIHLI